MNHYELLESINFIDEDLLLECESAKHTRRPVVFKALLVAAMIAVLSITAVAANRFFADVGSGDVVPHTFHIKTMDADWNVTKEEIRNGYVLTAKIETVQAVPAKLKYPYLPVVSEEWECSGAANGKYNGEIGMVGISWTYMEDGQKYKVFYRQESAYLYNVRDDDSIWLLDDVPEDVTLDGEVVTIGDASVYRVSATASEHSWSQPSYAHNMIFWSDGYSIFQLQVPQYWSDDRVYELMCSLTLQENMEAAITNLK